MTPEQVRERVADVRRLRLDPEGAHGAEDRLHQDVLRAVADGHPDASDLAAEALMTTGIEFERWAG